MKTAYKVMYPLKNFLIEAKTDVLMFLYFLEVMVPRQREEFEDPEAVMETARKEAEVCRNLLLIIKGLQFNLLDKSEEEAIIPAFKKDFLYLAKERIPEYRTDPSFSMEDFKKWLLTLDVTIL